MNFAQHFMAQQKVCPLAMFDTSGHVSTDARDQVIVGKLRGARLTVPALCEATGYDSYIVRNSLRNLAGTPGFNRHRESGRGLTEYWIGI